MQRALIAALAGAAALLAGSAQAADDHLKCYKIRDPLRLRGSPPSLPSWLDLTGPEFGSEQCRIFDTFRLYCTPVAKTVTQPIERKIGTGPFSPFTPAPIAGAETLTQDKLCYRIKCTDNAVPAPDVPHPVTDQFGDRSVTRFRPFMLCGPAEQATSFVTTMTGAQEVPPNASIATGSCTGELSGVTFTMSCTHDVVNVSDAHVHLAPPGVDGGIVFPFASPVSPINAVWNMTATQLDDLLAGNLYVNIHSVLFPGGEIRGQWEPAP